MAEYIDREAALKVLAGGRGCGNICSQGIRRIPAADVVEVVRCKDCRYGETQEGCDDLYCRELDTAMGKYDFCSYGNQRGRKRND